MNGKPEEQEHGWVPQPDPTRLTTQQLVREIGGLRELLDQRIDLETKTISTRFDLVEDRRKEQKDDTKSAVDAALAAAKEAVDKSERATKAEVGQLAARFEIGLDEVRRVLDDMKERIGLVDAKVSAVEQQKVGATENRTGIQGWLAAFVGVIAIGLTIIGFIVASNGA